MCLMRRRRLNTTQSDGPHVRLSPTPPVPAPVPPLSPSAGGAGGKGVWGKPGAELEDAEIDSGDPNYDSESMDDDVQLDQVTVVLTEEEVKVGATRESRAVGA